MHCCCFIIIIDLCSLCCGHRYPSEFKRFHERGKTSRQGLLPILIFMICFLFKKNFLTVPIFSTLTLMAFFIMQSGQWRLSSANLAALLVSVLLDASHPTITTTPVATKPGLYTVVNVPLNKFIMGVIYSHNNKE